jgi:hypothetical protein
MFIKLQCISQSVIFIENAGIVVAFVYPVRGTLLTGQPAKDRTNGVMLIGDKHLKV